MKGSISEEALNQYNRLVAEKQGLDFAEGDTYDFTTCIRSDGSAYGTGGTCRKGTEGEAKAKEPGSSSGIPILTRGDMKGMKESELKDIKKRMDNEAFGTGTKPMSNEKMKAMFEQNKAINEELASRGSTSAASAPAKRQLATSADAKSAWQESEKAVKAAKANLKSVGAETMGDKSPGARERRRKAAEALDKVERKALKASDKYFAARKREERSAMTPAQRKLEREADQLTKGG